MLDTQDRKNSFILSDLNRCRICLLSEDETNSEIWNLCACRGTSGSIHLDCLETWLKTNDRKNCEICFQPYRITRQPMYNVLSSIPAFINENAFYKWVLLYCLLASLAIIVFVLHAPSRKYATWDCTFLFLTIFTFFLLSIIISAIKEWSDWRQEQYRLTPTDDKKKLT